MQEKIMTDVHQDLYLKLNLSRLLTLAGNFVTHESQDEFINTSLKKHSHVTYLMLKQMEHTNADKWELLINKMVNQRGRLDIILGKKGSGKTSLMYWIAEELHHRGQEIWYVGPPNDVPYFIKNTTMDILKVPFNATALVDETHLQYNSRDSMRLDQSNFMKHLTTQRHTGRNFIIVTLNLHIIDISFIRNATAIFFKTYALLQDENERTVIHRDLKMFMPTRVNEVLYYDDDGLLHFDYPLKTWWRDKYSMPYGGFRNDGHMYKFISKLVDELDDKAISEQIDYKGRHLSEVDVVKLRMLMERIGTDKILKLDDSSAQEMVSFGFDDTPIGLRLRNKRLRINGNFELRPYQREEFEIRKGVDPNIEIMANYNVNDLLIEEIRNAKDKGLNLIFSIYGGTGSGKSWASMAIMECIDYVFGIKSTSKNISFRKNLLMARLTELKNKREKGRGTTLVLDEQVRSHGIGSWREETEMHDIEETLRDRQIHFIFNSPSLKPHQHHLIFEVMGIDRKLSISKLLMYSGQGNMLGYITIGAPSKRLLDEYKPKKVTFQDEVQVGTVTTGSEIDLVASEVMSDSEYLIAKTRGQKQAAIRRYIKRKSYRLKTGTEISEVYDTAELLRLKNDA